MSSLSMNSLSEVIDEITPHSSTKSSTKKYYRRSGINNGYNYGSDKNDNNDYEEKINHNHITIPNPTISFTATSTGTPIIIANHININNNSMRSNDSPPPSASTSITPTSSIGSARGENNHSINDNNNINNNNDNNNNNEEEEVQEKEGEERGVGGEITDDSPSSIDDHEGGDGLLKRPSQYDNSRNLHVDNLPPITEVEFRSLFLPFGIIARSRIVTDVVTGLPSGYGFVMFEREEDAYRALHSLHNKILPNTTRPLRVTFKKPKSLKAYQREKEKEKERDELLAHGHQPSLSTLFVNTNLYVAGIPLGWKKKELDDIFAPYGTILESRILTDRSTGLSKGVGFVRFQHLESCHNATKYLNGKPPIGAPADSQNLTVRFAVDRTAQALAVAQQTVMATVGGGAGSGSGSGGKGGSDHGGKNHSNNNINMIPSRSYTSHSSPHNNNNIGITNNTNNNNNNNANTPNLLTSSPSHLSPSHYLQFQTMIALQHQQQQQMIANRMAVAAAMSGGTTDQSITIPNTINHSTYLYPFTQSALSMAAAAAINASTNNPLMIAPITNNNNPSSTQLNVNTLNQYLNASASATTTDPAYYSQVFV